VSEDDVRLAFLTWLSQPRKTPSTPTLLPPWPKFVLTIQRRGAQLPAVITASLHDLVVAVPALWCPSSRYPGRSDIRLYLIDVWLWVGRD
jgi:hypothetical protein